MSERSSVFADVRRSMPPMPWRRWDDEEPIGWSLCKSMWKSWLLPYRTAELLGFDDETLEMKLGPWHWHAPGIVKVFRDR